MDIDEKMKEFREKLKAFGDSSFLKFEKETGFNVFDTEKLESFLRSALKEQSLEWAGCHTHAYLEKRLEEQAQRLPSEGLIVKRFIMTLPMDIRRSIMKHQAEALKGDNND